MIAQTKVALHKLRSVAEIHPWLSRALAVLLLFALVSAALLVRHASNDPTFPFINTGPGPAGASTGALLSHGRPVACSEQDAGPGMPEALVDGQFGNWGFWETSATNVPSWCAIHLQPGPTSVVFAWFSDYTFDYAAANGVSPAAYTLAVSANSTNGADGTWKTVATVRNNQARAREHLLPFTGDSWVKMTVTAGEPQASQPYIAIDEIEVHDASTSATLDDSYFFSGDSITATAYSQFAEHQPSFAADVHAAIPARWPLMIDGGFGGWTSGGAVQQIGSWLALNPDMHYWLLEWGTNDAFDQVAPADFRANLQVLAEQIKAAGHVPIFARLPPVHLPDANQSQQVNQEIDALNAVIDQLTASDGLHAGPDLHALFAAHLAAYLEHDGTHPSNAGSIAMNKAWFEALLPLIQ